MDVEDEVERIVQFIKSLMKNSEAEGIVVGLSGGIDSATTAALCVRAIGNDHVLALILPCHSNEADKVDGLSIAEHLGIQYKLVDLTETFDIFFKTLSNRSKSTPLAKANLKPRLRMCALYFYANQRNFLVAGTGNKSEDVIGYFTKYGDGGVDFLPISHLYKHEVREIARYLELPQNIIARKPTAGLWDGQTDEDELSKQLGFFLTYEKLDTMLENIEHNKFDEDNSQYRKLLELIEKNKHKIAYPPALKRV
ncbi:MAG: NAD+ synthase [Promethearchaeota archaeon]